MCLLLAETFLDIAQRAENTARETIDIADSGGVSAVV